MTTIKTLTRLCSIQGTAPDLRATGSEYRVFSSGTPCSRDQQRRALSAFAGCLWVISFWAWKLEL